MSVYQRKIGNSTYRIFQTSENRQLSLGTVGKEDPKKVLDALKYIKKKREEVASHYSELEKVLVGLLPEEERRRLQETARGTTLPTTVRKLAPRTIALTISSEITPDPSLEAWEIGVPIEFAMKLTVPEKVIRRNLDYLRELVAKGPLTHPGANFVIRPDNLKIRIDYVSDRNALARSLVPGYIVERHLVDGDIVISNLPKSSGPQVSVSAYSTKVLPSRTYRLNPKVYAEYSKFGNKIEVHTPASEEEYSAALAILRPLTVTSRNSA